MTLLESVFLSVFQRDAIADEKASPEKPQPVELEFTVPDGSPQEIMQFVGKLSSRAPRFANTREQADFAIKVQRAIIVAGDKILNQETDERTAVNAARMKLGAMTVLATNDVGDSAREALDAAKKLRGDKRASVSRVVDLFWLPIRVANVTKLTAEERKQLVNEFLTATKESKFARESAGAAIHLGGTLATKGFADEAADFFDRLAKLAKDADETESQKIFEALHRFTVLPGKSLLLEGMDLKGHELDWDAYRGKVVLIDFWATWCRPCLAEIPNIKEVYKKYHDKGFEVVAVCLDHSREPAEKFIDSEQIPWTQLYDESLQKGNGMKHPMALRFGIVSIPAAILVDQKGIVVSNRARGDELPRLLEKLLP